MTDPAEQSLSYLRFDVDCIGLLEDHSIRHVEYPVDTKNSSLSTLNEPLQIVLVSVIHTPFIAGVRQSGLFTGILDNHDSLLLMSSL